MEFENGSKIVFGPPVAGGGVGQRTASGGNQPSPDQALQITAYQELIARLAETALLSLELALADEQPEFDLSQVYTGDVPDEAVVHVTCMRALMDSAIELALRLNLPSKVVVDAFAKRFALAASGAHPRLSSGVVL